MIVQGFPPEKLQISSFNTAGTLLKPRHYSAAGIQHMLKGIGASGGTIYSSGVRAFHDNGVRIPEKAELILFAVGDEAGEEDGLRPVALVEALGPRQVAPAQAGAPPSVSNKRAITQRKAARARL